jgi:hypothetical protein
MRTPTTPMPVSARDELEATVSEYHHVQGEHRRAGAEGSVRRHLHARLGRLEAHFERLLEESAADEMTRDEWRHHLHDGTPAPSEPRPPRPALLFKGRAETGSVAEVRRRADGDCDVFVDGAHLERVAASRELAEAEIPLTFRIDHQEFREIFEAPGRAIAAARAYFSHPSGEPPWQHAAALLADGLVDGTFALTPRGRRALGGRRTG